ncbi:hypothetical protein BKA83DRAFT_4121280 [Pisolithus microcarpus]|nr:hypothetical protein BKA83DRAFT_4121280 [Pisolithus microcarpus]
MIARDPLTHGATFVPIILGSDKMTVSVATSQNDYWLVYLSVGNIHNNVQCAHCSGVELLAFLMIPKAVKKYTDDPTFQHFKKQLFHVAMSKVLGSLKACMMVPQVMKCPDEHFHHVICGIGPYIADYPEQVLISGIVQNCCGRCTVSPDDLDAGGPPCTAQLMRVLIEELQANATWDKWGIDANVVPFTEDFPCADICQLLAPDILHQLIKGGFKDHLMEWILTVRLQRFPDGWGLSQWTGDDSKALMKNVITEDMLSDLKMALACFHQHHENFWDVESKHIIAVKKPWWQSSKHNVLGQILQTNQCLTQLAAAHANYEACGMLPSSHSRGTVSSQDPRHHTVLSSKRETSSTVQGLNNGEDKDEHAGIVDEWPVLTHSDMKLAQCHGLSVNFYMNSYTMNLSHPQPILTVFL